MTTVEAFGQIAAGLRLALILLAFMVLLTSGRWHPDAISPARQLKARCLNFTAWTLMAIAVLTYSPAHAAWLLGHTVSRPINRFLDAVGAGLACASFIKLLAARGLMRGLSWERTVRGIIVNNVMVAATVGAVWAVR